LELYRNVARDRFCGAGSISNERNGQGARTSEVGLAVQSEDCGRGRVPESERPNRRVIFGFAQVSSMKTTRFGSIAVWEVRRWTCFSYDIRLDGWTMIGENSATRLLIPNAFGYFSDDCTASEQVSTSLCVQSFYTRNSRWNVSWRFPTTWPRCNRGASAGWPRTDRGDSILLWACADRYFVAFDAGGDAMGDVA
jgi:hypothetical protein